MKEIKAIIRPERLSDVLRALHRMPRLPGVTVSHVRGFGRQVPADPEGDAFAAVDMTKLEIVVPTELATGVVSVIERAAHTGRAGDGKIFIASVDSAVRVRSGERDLTAL
jgi:nitrogen regulatory protein P-II 1